MTAPRDRDAMPDFTCSLCKEIHRDDVTCLAVMIPALHDARAALRAERERGDRLREALRDERDRYDDLARMYDALAPAPEPTTVESATAGKFTALPEETKR